MNRVLMFLLASVFTLTAQARNWQFIEDGTDGIRLVVDTDSINVKKYKKDKKTNGIAVSAVMSYVNGTTDPIMFITGIDGEDCIKRDGGIIINVYPDKTETNYFWSKHGGKIYDAQGQWLCGALNIYIDEVGKQDKKKSPRKANPKINV